SSDVCSSDLCVARSGRRQEASCQAPGDKGGNYQQAPVETDMDPGDSAQADVLVHLVPSRSGAKLASLSPCRYGSCGWRHLSLDARSILWLMAIVISPARVTVLRRASSRTGPLRFAPS